MNKGILVKAGIVLGAFILAIGLAWGCTAVKNNDKSATLENGEEVYVTIDGVDVTRSELYKEMILSNGANYLVQYAEELLLKDYMDKVTDEELLAEKEILTFQTDDQDLIAELKEDADTVEYLEQSLKDQMMVLGYDSDDIDDLRSYLALNIAKQKFLNDYFDGLDEDDPLYISDEDVEEYYDANNKGSVNVLTVRFSSDTEAKQVMYSMNLIPNFDDTSWGLYNPALNEEIKAEDAVQADSISEDNTVVLTDEEAFDYFVEIWNFMNPNETPLTGDLSYEDFTTMYNDMTLVDYADYTRGEAYNADVTTYSNYIFDTLELPDAENTDVDRYSYKVQTVGDFAILSFKLAETEATPYLELTDSEKAEQLDLYKTSQQSTANLDVAMEELWLENELVIYDPIMKLQYTFQEGKEFDNNGSTKIVATLGELEITPEDLFDYMADAYGLYSAIELAQTKSLLQSDLFDTVYEDTDDYLKSDNEKMQKHIEDLEGFKSYFESNAFAQAGLSSEDYTWSEFVILYLQCEDDFDVLEKISIAGNLQSYLINDSINYEDAVNFMTEQAENYFSLNVEHLLLYRDDDFNFSGDDYSDYLDSLEGADLTEYNALVASFQAFVVTKVQTDEMTLEEIVEEYNESIIGEDGNVWSPFKEAGFYVLTQNLSTSASNTYLNTYQTFDEDFVTNLKRVYDAYVLDVKDSAETPDHYADNKVFATDFGVHYIYATEGDAFEQPTAVFDNADGDYVDANVGTTVVPNKEQIELFISTSFSSVIGEENTDTIAESVQEAITAYYAPLYGFYWPSDNNESMPVTIITIQYALDNNVTFANDSDQKVADLESILEALIEMNFPKGFLPEED